jgi:glycosyltransferase involved in cell wall biosynthesis
MQAENLAVCIPLDSSDIQYLDRCLRSIKAQTRKPEQIHISASRCTKKHERQIRDICFELRLQTQIQIHSTVLLAGANRNRAAKAAKEHGATILFFFDSDDIMHPRRIEIIAKHFERDATITGVLNRYIFGPKEKMGLEDIPWKPLRGIVHTNAFDFFDCGGFRTHHLKMDYYKDTKLKGIDYVACGPMTIRSRFWEKHPYDETQRIGEDQHFNSKVVEEGENLAYIPDILSVFTTCDRTEYDFCEVCTSAYKENADLKSYSRESIAHDPEEIQQLFQKMETLRENSRLLKAIMDDTEAMEQRSSKLSLEETIEYNDALHKRIEALCAQSTPT